MAEESFEEKTEQATPRKREEAREKGEVAKSRELPSVAVLLAAMFTLTFLGSHIYSQIRVIMQTSFSLPLVKDLNISEFLGFAQEIFRPFMLAIGPPLAAAFITAILANVVQIGFKISPKSLKPKFSKLNPLKGFGRLFSKQSFMELAKSLFKLALVSTIAYLTIKSEMSQILLLGTMELNSIFIYMLTTFLKIAIRCTLAMIFLAVIDYAFQKWDFEKRLKMTKKEAKDDHKRTEGDPLIKSKIRSIQREMARKRMMEAVPQADVVITNPTHLAVALKYEAASMGAPKLVAKGAGKVAQRIKELAGKYNIPLIENKELARSLYQLAEIDQEIPPNLYPAVAEVLAYIYKLKTNYASSIA